MDKTKAAILAAGLALGAAAQPALTALGGAKPYASGLIVGRLPAKGGGHVYATGAVTGGHPVWAQLVDGGTALSFKDLPSKPVAWTAADQKCLDQVLDRHAIDLLRE